MTIIAWFLTVFSFPFYFLGILFTMEDLVKWTSRLGGALPALSPLLGLKFFLKRRSEIVTSVIMMSATVIIWLAVPILSSALFVLLVLNCVRHLVNWFFAIRKGIGAIKSELGESLRFTFKPSNKTGKEK